MAGVVTRRTVDGGRTFRASGVTFLNRQSWLLALHSSGAFEYATTVDAGRSWLYRRRALPAPDPGRSWGSVVPVAFLDAERWLAAAESCTAAEVCTARLLRTRDRGHTWQRLGRLPPGVLPNGHVTFIDHFHGWAEVFAYGGLAKPALYATGDGGWTWRELTP